MPSQVLSHAHKAAQRKPWKKKKRLMETMLSWFGAGTAPLPFQHQHLPSPRKAHCMKHSSIPCNTLHVEGSFELDRGSVSSSQPRVEQRLHELLGPSARPGLHLQQQFTAVPKAAELLASQRRRDKQESRRVSVFLLPQQRCLGRREAPGKAAREDAVLSAVLSAGLQHAAALQSFKGEPSSCCSSWTTR